MKINMQKKKVYHKVSVNRHTRKTIDNETIVTVDPVDMTDGVDVEVDTNGKNRTQ